jgi:NDP-sugar pyrophosphorylase family protein
MNAEDFFQLPLSLKAFAEFFRTDVFPWDWIRQVGPALDMERFVPKRSAIPDGFQTKGFAYLHPSVSFPLFGSLEGPAWLGEGVVLEPGVVLRGNVIIGAGCTVGAGAVLENCLLLEGVRVSPQALIADSVVGNGSFIGVGTSIIARRLTASARSESTALGFASLEALGSVIGDRAELGHHSLIMPGSVLTPDTRVPDGMVYSSPLPS